MTPFVLSGKTWTTCFCSLILLVKFVLDKLMEDRITNDLIEANFFHRCPGKLHTLQLFKGVCEGGGGPDLGRIYHYKFW